MYMGIIKLRGIYGKGKEALVDDELLEELSTYKWFLSSPTLYSKQYIRTRIGSNSDVRLHRFIMKAKKGESIDHINHNTLDNRKCNLRFCTNQQNQWNSRTAKDKRSINGIVPPKGIAYDKTRPHRPWYGKVSNRRKFYYTKGYPTMEEAHKAYIELSNKHYGEFNWNGS